jgi:hypothetical protein
VQRKSAQLSIFFKRTENRSVVTGGVRTQKRFSLNNSNLGGTPSAKSPRSRQTCDPPSDNDDLAPQPFALQPQRGPSATDAANRPGHLDSGARWGNLPVAIKSMLFSQVMADAERLDSDRCGKPCHSRPVIAGRETSVPLAL